jgi:CRISPR-associated endonuclease Csn1
MKKILGLDLGVASIGWAYTKEAETENEQSEIVDLGVRIIPIVIDSKTQFEKGQAITINQDRTLKRGARRNLDRYQLRRKSLVATLKSLNMLPNEDLIKLNTLELYALRDKALKQKLELNEIGRILLHLNQKRGYKSSRKEDAKLEGDTDKKKKESDYLGGISSKSAYLKEHTLTVGQKQYLDFKENSEKNEGKIISKSIKNEVYPREDYITEFNAVWDAQALHYKNILTENNKLKIRDEIIYHQRPLKSQKGLVSICELEGKKTIVKNKGKEGEKFIGPRVAIKSNPLAQLSKLWESINTLSFDSRDAGTNRIPTIEEKNKLFEYLNNNPKISKNEICIILGDKTLRSNQQFEKAGLRGNETRIKIIEALKTTKLDEATINNLVSFNLHYKPVVLNDSIKQAINSYQSKSKNKKFEVTDVAIDKHSGEIITLQELTTDIEKEPLYLIWHLLHSIDNKEELKNALLKNEQLKKLGLTQDAAIALTKVVFKNDDYGSKSVKSIRKILPYLTNGYVYSDACALAGYNHSNSITKETNLKRELLTQLPQLKKGELRQPVVEKILNQLINLINAILNEPAMGRPDEIRIELARELQQSAEERSDSYTYNNKRNTENDEIAKEIEKYGLKPTGHRIKKWRVWHETKGYSFYTGKQIGLSEFLNAQAVDIEHIIPQSIFFDNSLSNWTICEREENIKKGNIIAFDWMNNKGTKELEEYIKQVNYFYSQFIAKDTKEKAIYRVGISKRKRDYLLMPFEKIPNDFISRQLNETRYITRKSAEILNQICHHVKITSGSVTDYLRHHWGYDNILHDLNFERYKNAGLTYINEDKKERIVDWTKRMDHRHHAIDALVVACTKQSIIQRLNNLNQKKEKFQNIKEVDNKGLKKLVQEFKLFNTQEVSNKIESTLVSFKAGKRVVSRRKNKVGNQSRLEPRGPLHEESVYGLIKRIAEKPLKLNSKFKLEDVETIVSTKQLKLVRERLEAFDNNPVLAFDKLSKSPIWLSQEPKQALTEVKVFEYTTAIKYKLNDSFKEKDAEYIIDKAIRELVKNRFKYKGSNALKDIENNPVLFNGKPIKSVRCYAEVSAYEVLKFDKEKNKPKSVVKPGNNHHVTICADENGKQYELETVTFWEAVARAKQGLPIYSTPKEANHKVVCTLQENEIVEISDANNQNKFFRLRKMSNQEYYFLNIYCTEVDYSITAKKIGNCLYTTPTNFKYKKSKINLLGKLVA